MPRHAVTIVSPSHVNARNNIHKITRSRQELAAILDSPEAFSHYRLITSF